MAVILHQLCLSQNLDDLSLLMQYCVLARVYVCVCADRERGVCVCVSVGMRVLIRVYVYR